MSTATEETGIERYWREQAEKERAYDCLCSLRKPEYPVDAHAIACVIFNKKRRAEVESK